MRKNILSTGIFMLISANVLLAQDSLKYLNEVVVTATRSAQEVIDVARSVEVIDEEEIKKSSYASVGELLSRKTALFVVGGTQTPGTNQDIFLRGANSNHITILVDGVRVTDPSSPNSAFNLAELSLANVERIEIVYGAHSTLYGTAALGGTINIITKKGQKGLQGHGSLQGGTFDGGGLAEGSGYLNYGFKNGVYITTSAFHQQVKGLDATVDTITSSFKTADNDDFQKTDLSLKTGFDNNAWSGFLEYKRASQIAAIDDGAFDDDDNYTVDLKRDFLNYATTYSKGKWKVTFNGGYSHSERTAENDSSIVDESGNYDRIYFTSFYLGSVATNELLTTYKSEKTTFILGFGQYHERMEFNNYYFSDGPFGIYESEVNYDSLDLVSRIRHIFLSGNINPVEKLHISYGGRLNTHNSFGNHFTWEVSPSYRIFKNATLYFSYSKGFNAPSLYQLYDPTHNVDQPKLTRGNHELQPEKGRSIEAGWKQILPNDIAFTLSLFNNKVNDAIEYVYIWDGDTPQEELSYLDHLGDTYINVNEQEIQGIEASVNGRFFKDFSFYINSTFLQANVQKIEDIQVPEKIIESHIQLYSNGIFINEEAGEDNLVRRPSFLTNAGIGYTFSQSFSLNADFQHVGNRNDAIYDPSLGPYGALATMRMKPYNLFHISGNFRFNENFSTSLTIKNILNEDYNEVNGFNTLGRSAFVKLVYEF